MFHFVLLLHSAFRWLLLIALLCSIARAAWGYARSTAFSAADNALRHWTATVAHLQLVMGMWLYLESPVTHAFRQAPAAGLRQPELRFFGILHIGCMLLAVILLTIGSAMAKRRKTDREKFRTMLTWFSLTLLIILIAIPWPFSPLARRPLFRI
jgi:hypothetical protein